MASDELRRLWKLHQIDVGLQEVRSRAAHLDPGKAEMAELAKIEAQEAEATSKAKALAAELSDLELAQKAIDDKIKKIDRELYGGKVVNPREVENIEKEIAALKRQRGGSDERILKLWEETPPAKAAAEESAKRVEAAKQKLQERRKIALSEKSKLEKEYATLMAQRPEAAKAVSASLLARYESIKQKHDGIGMAQVLKTRCTGCGTQVPERIMDALKNDRIASCESCHRILYWTEGVV